MVFGLAFLGEGGTGKYGDIFYDRVKQVHRDFGSNVSSLLGTVAAHKLDHLLLGSHAYYYAGVTAPAWNEDIFRRMEMGSLLFTGAQAARMRTRIRGGDASLVSLKAKEGKLIENNTSWKASPEVFDWAPGMLSLRLKNSCGREDSFRASPL